jgi:hypothetical protein
LINKVLDSCLRRNDPYLLLATGFKMCGSWLPPWIIAGKDPIAIFRAPEGLPTENPVFRLRIFGKPEERRGVRRTKWHGCPFFASGLRRLLVLPFFRASKEREHKKYERFNCRDKNRRHRKHYLQNQESGYSPCGARQNGNGIRSA